MFTKILLRRDYSWNWSANNSLLSPGEIGFELDTGKFKWGVDDGETSNYWNDLNYYVIQTSAPRLQNAVLISLTNDVSGSAYFDGSQNIYIPVTLNKDIMINWSNVYQKPDPLIQITGDVEGHGYLNQLDSCSIVASISHAMSRYLVWSGISNIPSPTITLTGDVSGSGIMNELGDVTIHVTINQ
jgi:hypothetical protein